MRTAAAIVILTSLAASAPVAAQPGSPLGPTTLLDGARAFREGRFAEALVSFRVAEKVPVIGREALWYAAATLYRLGRVEEAFEAFVRADREAPELRDAVLDFYFASAAYELRLYLFAQARLTMLASQAGPKLGAEVSRLREKIAPLFVAPPDPRAVDWYLARAAQLKESRRTLLAHAFFDEAAELAKRRTPAYRLEDATAGLAQTSDEGGGK